MTKSKGGKEKKTKEIDKRKIKNKKRESVYFSRGRKGERQRNE